MQFALTYAANAFDLRGPMMGRQSAGVGFLRAILGRRPERVWCYAASRSMAETFGRDVIALTDAPPEIRFIAFNEPSKLAHTGTLYRGDPNIADDAWRRQTNSGARAYSLCGITHTLASKGAMSVMSRFFEAPLYSWDAIICTSRAARDVVRYMLESKIDYFKARFGNSNFIFPQFPMIPLGVHCHDFVFTPELRQAARAEFGIGTEDVAVLYAGRLSFHAKAHPLPMFLALESAAVTTRKIIHLVLFGQFSNDAIATAFRMEAAQFAPSVRLIVVDGKSDDNRGRAWASADLFTSLSDNIQETFGLTPVEAMAAGLPVVVSDWNGYKDTVRDGVDGFRIPTVMPPPGTGRELAMALETDILAYDRYVGAVSLFSGVDVGAATLAYQKLIESASLRREMGEAGYRRARALYDWSIIIRRYIDLWEELAERRRGDPLSSGESWQGLPPDAPDPFALFQTYPTKTLQSDTWIGLEPNADLQEAAARKALASVNYALEALPADELIGQMFVRLGVQPEGMTVGDLIGAAPPMPPLTTLRAVAWLIKMGLVKIKN